MKKVLSVLIVLLFVTCVFSYTLGIKGALTSVNLPSFSKAIKVTEVFSNSLASSFLKKNDLILVLFSRCSWGPQSQSSSRKTVQGTYISNASSYREYAISGTSDFAQCLSSLETSSCSFIFIVYRNGRYIEYSVF